MVRWPRSVLMIVSLVAPTILFGGCGSPSRERKTLIETNGVIHETGPVLARELLPLRQMTGEFWVRSDRGPDRTVSYSLKSDDGQLWIETLEHLQVTVLKLTPEGGVAINHEIAFDERVRVEYDPPLLLLPPLLERGKPVETICRMTVLNLSDGQLRESGQVVYTVELIGGQTIESHDGRDNAFVLTMKREIQLLTARSTVFIRAAYVPGKGLVAEHVVRETKILGMISTRQEQYRRRVS